jgi:hypothetical protein
MTFSSSVKPIAPLVFIYLFIFGCSGVWTQGFELSRQALLAPISHPPWPISLLEGRQLSPCKEPLWAHGHEQLVTHNPIKIQFFLPWTPGWRGRRGGEIGGCVGGGEMVTCFVDKDSPRCTHLQSRERPHIKGRWTGTSLWKLWASCNGLSPEQG